MAPSGGLDGWGLSSGRLAAICPPLAGGTNLSPVEARELQGLYI